jgi:predicted GNAT family acetyltransferase
LDPIEINIASADADPILVDHYMAIWDSYGTPAAAYSADAAKTVKAFIAEGRQKFELVVVVAKVGEHIVGSAAGQVRVAPFPIVTQPAYRKTGYIWSVFVEPSARRRGIAAMLVERLVAELSAIGCFRVLLHPSEAAESVYRKLGFQNSNEMRLDL